MKNLIIVLVGITACMVLSGASKGKGKSYIGIWRCQVSRELYPEYLILKRGGTFDYNCAYRHDGYIGKFSFSNDTLTTIPMYRYYEDTIVRIHPEDTTVFSIPRKYLLKNQELIEITDFDPYPIMKLFQSKDPDVYKIEK